MVRRWGFQSNQVIIQTDETEGLNLISNTGLAKRLVAKLSFCLYFYKTFFSWRLTQLVNLVQFTLVGLEDKVSSKGTLTKKKHLLDFGR